MAISDCKDRWEKILTHLGFGLNVDPLIMKAIVSAVLLQEEAVECAASAYINNIHINEDPIYPTPPLGQDMTQGQFLKRSLAGLNSEFSFS